MIPLENITGRLGNNMFQFAALYALSKELGVDYFFQDEKYFGKYKNDIRSLFGTGIGYLSQVSIHVRRGDYVNNPFYIDLSKTNYYEEAIKLFPSDNFLVFSDDPEFCKQIFTGPRFQIMEKKNEVEDLNLMASCKSNILANSSYSWWAGWLNPNPSKRVVAPSVKNWYSDGVERTVCPQDWIRI